MNSCCFHLIRFLHFAVVGLLNPFLAYKIMRLHCTLSVPVHTLVHSPAMCEWIYTTVYLLSFIRFILYFCQCLLLRRICSACQATAYTHKSINIHFHITNGLAWYFACKSVGKLNCSTKKHAFFRAYSKLA